MPAHGSDGGVGHEVYPLVPPEQPTTASRHPAAVARLLAGFSAVILGIGALHAFAATYAATASVDVEGKTLLEENGIWWKFEHMDYPGGDITQVAINGQSDFDRVSQMVVDAGHFGFSVCDGVAYVKGGPNGPTDVDDLENRDSNDGVDFFAYLKPGTPQPLTTLPTQAPALTRAPAPVGAPAPGPSITLTPDPNGPTLVPPIEARQPFEFPHNPEIEPVCNNSPTSRTIYMYRAQSESEYDFENINAASLVGVLWYLHNEVVIKCPRRNYITRILRRKITMQWFVAYVAYDAGHCTTPDAERGLFFPGCQPRTYADLNGFWYSLPGKCPRDRIKMPGCYQMDPGGACGCNQTLGEGYCTYQWEDAGEVNLNEIIGLGNVTEYIEWCRQGGLEYDPATGWGRNTDWWNGFDDGEQARRRVDEVRDAFKKKYPDMPLDLDEERCP